MIHYSAMREQYMRNGEGFLVVYSITSRLSFEEIEGFYQQIRRVKDKDHFPMVLIANKCDLESERQVSSQEGKDAAKKYGCQFIESSAKFRINVDEAFHEVVRDIRRYNKEQELNSNRYNHNNLTASPNTGAGARPQHDEASSKCCILM